MNQNIPNIQNIQNISNVLLYSKFSDACRMFMDGLNRVPEFKKTFNTICIDNKEVRERIVQNEKLNVKQVPCLLRIHESNGYVELFEGDKAFQILNSYIQAEQQRIQQIQQQQQKLQQQKLEQQKLEQQKLEQQKAEKEEFVPSKAGNPNTLSTSILDLEDEDSKNIATYLHVPKNKDTLRAQEDRVIPERAVKNVEQKKASSITNLAQQMQRERDASAPPANSGMGNPRIP
jgi:hypothetical protein